MEDSSIFDLKKINGGVRIYIQNGMTYDVNVGYKRVRRNFRGGYVK